MKTCIICNVIFKGDKNICQTCEENFKNGRVYVRTSTGLFCEDCKGVDGLHPVMEKYYERLLPIIDGPDWFVEKFQCPLCYSKIVLRAFGESERIVKALQYSEQQIGS